MSGQHTYILRLLRELEGTLAGPGSEAARGVLGKIAQRVSAERSIKDALEILYSVEGYEAFALRLLWCLDRAGISSPALNKAVIDHEVGRLGSLFMQTMNGRWSETVGALTPPISEPLESFYESLHRFGRCVEQCKRRAGEADEFQGVETDALYRLLNECSLLETASLNAGRGDVTSFAVAFAGCVQHIIDHDLHRDIRSLNIIESANLTLQTSLEAVGGEDDDSLRQMVALLRHPEGLLE